MPVIGVLNLQRCKTKLSDKTSMFWILMYGELLKKKSYTNDVTVYLIVDDYLNKDMVNMPKILV